MDNAPNEPEDKYGWLKHSLKVLGTVGVIFLLVVVVGFGLLVGFCAFLGKR